MKSSFPINGEDFSSVSDEQLAQQLQYYSDCAPEYNDWWHPKGPFDLGPQENEKWFSEAKMVLSALNSLDLGLEVLELAPGTGTWTVHLASPNRHLTLVDGSKRCWHMILWHRSQG